MLFTHSILVEALETIRSDLKIDAEWIMHSIATS
jgi:hypothetical protein